MELTIDAKDRVQIWVHHFKGAADVVAFDTTGEDGSIAEKRFKIGNIEIIIFEE